MRGITIIIFGGTGDLARKKLLPAINKLVRKGTIDSAEIVATGRRDLTIKQYCEIIGNPTLEKNVRLHYFQADFTKPGSLVGLPKFVESVESESSIGRLVYLATAPEYFETIAKQVSAGFEGKKFLRVLVEKPFGEDQASSRRLSKTLASCFAEKQIFRVDHYLGKETVQNILLLRLANPFIERTWNSEFIDKIAIDVSEDSGVGQRIAYYDKAGAVRDMVQNHMLQMLAFLLMEPPKSTEPEHIHESKAQALASLEFAGDIVTGQYESYLKELQKATNDETAQSDTETFVELSLRSRAKRWKGTKIFMRTGKMLQERQALMEISYRKEPCILFCDINTYPNRLVLHVQPHQDIDFHFNTKKPGKNLDIAHVKLNFCHEKEFQANTPESYEVILEDCIKGDHTLFISLKELDYAWKLTDKIRTAAPKPERYTRSTSPPSLR